MYALSIVLLAVAVGQDASVLEREFSARAALPATRLVYTVTYTAHARRPEMVGRSFHATLVSDAKNSLYTRCLERRDCGEEEKTVVLTSAARGVKGERRPGTSYKEEPYDSKVRISIPGHSDGRLFDLFPVDPLGVEVSWPFESVHSTIASTEEAIGQQGHSTLVRSRTSPIAWTIENGTIAKVEIDANGWRWVVERKGVSLHNDISIPKTVVISNFSPDNLLVREYVCEIVEFAFLKEHSDALWAVNNIGLPDGIGVVAENHISLVSSDDVVRVRKIAERKPEIEQLLQTRVPSGVSGRNPGQLWRFAASSVLGCAAVILRKRSHPFEE